MRKLLLATSALVAGVLGSGAASAELTVNVGGYADFRAGFMSEDASVAGLNRRQRDFETEVKLNIDAMGKAANNMEYGAHISLWNGSDYRDSFNGGKNSVRTEQAYVYMSGNWGKAIMGDEHGASDLLVYAPVVGINQIDGNYTDFISTATTAAFTPSYVDNLENSTKVVYYTPKVAGFQLGASYAPNLYDQGQNAVKWQQSSSVDSNGPNSGYTNFVEVGGQYTTSMQGVNVTMSGLMTTADADTKYTAGLKDFTSWGLGAQVNYAGVTVGGSYVDPGSFNKVTGNSLDQHVWNVGAKYEFGRTALAASFLRGQGYTGFGYVNDYKAYGVGATYALFPGMTTAVDAMMFNQDANANAFDNDGHVVILSQKLAF
jgi:outer membrane protein OmpU